MGRVVTPGGELLDDLLNNLMPHLSGYPGGYSIHYNIKLVTNSASWLYYNLLVHSRERQHSSLKTITCEPRRTPDDLNLLPTSCPSPRTHPPTQHPLPYIPLSILILLYPISRLIAPYGLPRPGWDQVTAPLPSWIWVGRGV